MEKLGGTVDFAYLEAFAAGDRTVVDEVLALFRAQAQTWAVELQAPAAGWRDVVHTIKGTSRGVGAFVVGDACAVAEDEGEAALPALVQALGAAVQEIAAYQAGER